MKAIKQTFDLQKEVERLNNDPVIKRIMKEIELAFSQQQPNVMVTFQHIANITWEVKNSDLLDKAKRLMIVLQDYQRRNYPDLFNDDEQMKEFKGIIPEIMESGHHINLDEEMEKARNMSPSDFWKGWAEVLRKEHELYKAQNGLK